MSERLEGVELAALRRIALKFGGDLDRAARRLVELEAEVAKLKEWVGDLQSGCQELRNDNAKLKAERDRFKRDAECYASECGDPPVEETELYRVREENAQLKAELEGAGRIDLMQTVALRLEDDKIRKENAKLKAERDRTMAVLKPNMPEQGLEDAARQLAQAYLAELGNADAEEKENARLREENVKLKAELANADRCVLERENANGALDAENSRLRDLLRWAFDFVSKVDAVQWDEFDKYRACEAALGPLPGDTTGGE